MRVPVSNPASPLKNRRHERFANYVAAGNMPLVACWAASFDPPRYATPTHRVSASKAARRPHIAARIQHIRRKLRERELATEALSEATPERLSNIMESVSRALRVAFFAAKPFAPHSTLAQLKEALTQHSGRAERFIRRAPAKMNDGPTQTPEIPAVWCCCD